MTTTKAMTRYLGRSATWQPSLGIRVNVTVTDMRESYGRTNCKIIPKAGNGFTWVRLDNLVFDKDTETP